MASHSPRATNIRVAEISEAEGIVDLINAAFRIEEFFIDGDRIGLDQVHSLFAKGEFLVADGDHAPAGCVYMEKRGERAYFGLLSIDPARQRSGLGSGLVAAAEQWGRERGCRFMDLRIVNLREELPAFYGRLGYAEDGTDPFTPDTPTKLPCHFVNMSKAL
jgi:GNAT superfamily N-acetyltransferase